MGVHKGIKNAMRWSASLIDLDQFKHFVKNLETHQIQYILGVNELQGYCIYVILMMVFCEYFSAFTWAEMTMFIKYAKKVYLEALDVNIFFCIVRKAIQLNVEGFLMAEIRHFQKNIDVTTF